MVDAPASTAPVAPQPRVVSEAEQRLIDLGNELWNDNSDRGKAFRAAAKAKYPEAITIEDRFEPIVAPLRAEAQALRDELAAERTRREEEAAANAKAAAERTLSDGVEAAVRHFNLTDEGRRLTLERMDATKNYTDPLGAAAFVVAANPPPKDPTGYLGPQAINLYGSADESAEERVKLLHKDPMGKFLDAEFRDFLTDPDQYIRDAGLAA
jgi:hypothetical protein